MEISSKNNSKETFYVDWNWSYWYTSCKAQTMNTILQKLLEAVNSLGERKWHCWHEQLKKEKNAKTAF